MRLQPASLAAALAAAAAATSYATSEPPLAPARDRPATGRAAIVAPREAAPHVVHSCVGQASPDRAVIAGGMTAEAVKPTETHAQLERQIAELQRVAAAHEGEVRLLERLRAARSVSERQASRTDPLPFVALQRLEVDVPARVNVDAVLEQVFRVGLDRYGSALRADQADTNARVVVRYRFSTLARELEVMHGACRRDAIRAWCAGPQARADLCGMAPADRERHFITQQLSLQTQPLLTEHGGVNRYRLNWPWPADQLSAIEPLGRIAVRFEGSLSLSIMLPAQ